MTKALKLLAGLLVAVPLFAQSQSQLQPQPQRTYSQAELDQMLAPIALYPDPLLSQILMAATYPIEVVEAARWTRANPNLQADVAVRAVDGQDWDPSVKSLVAFPQVLQRMDEQLSWTESLGDAFLAQEPELMDTVQQLRRRAQAAGNLQSSEQIYVQQQGQTIVVEPASPRYVYVPYYDPLVVYGAWWWPAYRPVYWAPWPGYARPYRSSVSAGFWWGAPVGLSVNFFFGNVDWRQRHVHVVHPTAYYYRPPVVVNRTVVVERGRWQHDPHHRRGVDYRAVEVRQRFAGAQAERREAQRPEQRQAQAPRPRQEAQTQARPEQTRPDRREAREEQPRQRSVASAAERAQQQQQRELAEASRAQQRQQADAARFQQQQRQQAEISRAQQRQQADTARFQQQQRQQAEASRAQQQQRHEQRTAMPAAKAPQTPRAERQERMEQRHERGQKG